MEKVEDESCARGEILHKARQRNKGLGRGSEDRFMAMHYPRSRQSTTAHQQA